MGFSTPNLHIHEKTRLSVNLLSDGEPYIEVSDRVGSDGVIFFHGRETIAILESALKEVREKWPQPSLTLV